MPLDQAGLRECGWLSKWAFQINALAADSFGRQAIEDAFFAATAEMRAKFADGFINTAKLADDAIETAKILDRTVTAVKLALATLSGSGLDIGLYGINLYGRCAYGYRKGIYGDDENLDCCYW